MSLNCCRRANSHTPHEAEPYCFAIGNTLCSCLSRQWPSQLAPRLPSREEAAHLWSSGRSHQRCWQPISGSRASRVVGQKFSQQRRLSGSIDDWMKSDWQPCSCGLPRPDLVCGPAGLDQNPLALSAHFNASSSSPTTEVPSYPACYCTEVR